jgi:hypothetical protein
MLLLFIGANYKMHSSSISLQCYHFMDAQCIESFYTFLFNFLSKYHNMMNFMTIL